jgi:hypothetical protein
MIQIPTIREKIGNTSLHQCHMGISHVPLKRNALTGFRSDWQHPEAAMPSTPNDSDTELALVDRLDYAADDSEDDTKEASSMSIKKPAKDNEPLKVRLTAFYH